jgi:hypothetical protein
MFFINLCARKNNGDFMITSTEVLQDQHPFASNETITEMLIRIGDQYEAEGYSLSYTFGE